LREEAQEAIDALMRGQLEDPSIFVRGMQLASINQDEQSQARIVTLGQAEIRVLLTMAANFFTESTDKQGRPSHSPVYPPKSTAEYILTLLNTHSLPFLPLQGITQAPVVRLDGSILDQPGYDSATKLYYIPGPGLEHCTIEDAPTLKAREEALKLVWEAIGEFCYATEADRANALALLLTPLLRPAIAGHIPLALIDAHKAGTGKTMLAQVVSLIATGHMGGVLAQPASDEEWDKRITGILLRGSPIVLIDNVAERLQGSSLEAVLTTGLYQGRILGSSEMVQVPNRAIWIATGNHLTVSPDLSRRGYRISLDAGVSQPWRRQGYAHPDLIGWVTERRANLLQALLTIVRAWYAAGQPGAGGTTALGTFSDWVRILDGILAHAGVTGFLRNLDQFYEAADDQSAEWTAFLEAWHAEFGESDTTVAKVIERINSSALGEALPNWLKLQQQEKPAGFNIRLGRALEKHAGIPYGPQNLQLVKGGKKHRGAIWWQVISRKEKKPGVLEEGGELVISTLSLPEAAPEADLGDMGESCESSSPCSKTVFNQSQEAEKAGAHDLPAQLLQQGASKQEETEASKHQIPVQSLQRAERSIPEEEKNTEKNGGKQLSQLSRQTCEVALQADLDGDRVESGTLSAGATSPEVSWELAGYKDQKGRWIDILDEFDEEGNGYTSYMLADDNSYLYDVTEVHKVYCNANGEEVSCSLEEE
jgi:hypothetical protein